MGGINITGGTPIINNCTIKDNASRGIYINANGNPIITRCTIINNTCTIGSAEGGVFYISSSASNVPQIINCTIVSNTVSGNDAKGHEIYINTNSTATLTNTLIWNADTVNAIYIDNSGGNITYNHCAYPNATGANDIVFNTWGNPVSSDVTVNGVVHKVFLAENNSVLLSLQGKGVSDENTPTVDQIGTARANPPSIGAVEYISFTLGDITKKQASLPEGKVNTAYSATLSEYFTATVDPAGTSITWSVDGTLPGGLICTDGVISGTPTTAGTFKFNVVATAGYSNKNIAASITIAAGTQTITGESGFTSLTSEQKREIVNLNLSGISDLSKLLYLKHLTSILRI